MRIVGIGASAGGLATFEDFFRNTPCDTGMAFLVVQHLDPTQKALLPELLQRYTEMPVYEAQQNMPIREDSVYVIPPNRELRVVNKTLKLDEPAQTRGCVCPSMCCFHPWPATRPKEPLPLCFRAWARMAPWDCRPSRLRAG